MAEAVARYDSAHMQLDMNMQGQTITADGAVRYGASSTRAMSMLMEIPGVQQPVDMRYLDGVFYVSMPPYSPAGKFVKFDPNDPSDPLARDMGDLTRMLDQMDPKASYEAIEQGIRMVEYEGEASSPQGRLHHYRVTVHMKTLIVAQGMDPRAARGAPKTVDYDMWLDEGNLMQRTSMEIMGLVMDVRFSDWGKPVNVTAPPQNMIVTPPRTNS